MMNIAKPLPPSPPAANAGINPPSVVHQSPEEGHFNFVQEGVNSAWRAGQPVEGWVGLVKFRFQPRGEVKMLAYRLGESVHEFSAGQKSNLYFTVSDFTGGVR